LKTLSTRAKCTTTSDHQSDSSDDTHYGQTTTTISAPSQMNNDNAATSLATTASDNDRVSLDDHGNSNSIHFSICPPECNEEEDEDVEEEEEEEEDIRIGDWLQMLDSDGNIYWCNEVSGEATWDEPS
jgi:hypothetical protein